MTGRPFVAMLLLAGSCAQRAAAPADSLEAYAAALERKDHAAAYAMMSAGYRREVSWDEFARQAAAHAAELAEDARALRAASSRWSERVEVSPREGERVPLVREGGVWRLDRPPFEPYGQSTPRAALRAFFRAIDNQRYDVLLRLAPARYRAILTVDELKAFWQGAGGEASRANLKELRLALDSRITEEGDEAFMTYGANGQVRFVREDGLWRIENPE